MRSKWVVRLGPPEWQRHTQSRNVGETVRMLGSVQRGAQVGALAVDGNGDFFQVNGEYLTPLNKHIHDRKGRQGRTRARAPSLRAAQAA